MGGYTQVASFAYDALGRRIEKYDAVSGQQTRYYYDDNRVILETNVAAAETDVRYYTYGNHIDETLVMSQPGSSGPTDIYYAHDLLYSTTALFDAAGTVVERVEYDAYGKARIQTAAFAEYKIPVSAYGNPYLFTGRQSDIIDGGSLTIQYSRARYYDPDTGRFLQRDPLGYADSRNLFEYVHSNPVNGTDPLGLFDIPTHTNLTLDALTKHFTMKNNCGCPGAFKKGLLIGSFAPDFPYVNANINANIPVELNKMYNDSLLYKGKQAIGEGMAWCGRNAAKVCGLYDNWESIRNWWQDSSFIEPVVDWTAGVFPSIQGNKLYQTHYGDNQWQHGMSKPGKTAAEVRDNITNDTLRLINAYREAMIDCDYEQAGFALGIALHYYQDSLTLSHTTRNPDMQITLFQDYGQQSPGKHKGADQLEVDSDRFKTVSFETALLMLLFFSDLPMDTNRDMLNEFFYPLSPNCQTGQINGDYKKGASCKK